MNGRRFAKINLTGIVVTGVYNASSIDDLVVGNSAEVSFSEKTRVSGQHSIAV